MIRTSDPSTFTPPSTGMAGMSYHAQVLIYSCHLNILTKSWSQFFFFSFFFYIHHNTICSFSHRSVLKSPALFSQKQTQIPIGILFSLLIAKSFPHTQIFIFPESCPRRVTFYFEPQSNIPIWARGFHHPPSHLLITLPHSQEAAHRLFSPEVPSFPSPSL